MSKKELEARRRRLLGLTALKSQPNPKAGSTLPGPDLTKVRDIFDQMGVFPPPPFIPKTLKLPQLPGLTTSQPTEEKKGLTAQDIQAIRILADEGTPSVQIAESLGVDVRDVLEILGPRKPKEKEENRRPSPYDVI